MKTTLNEHPSNKSIFSRIYCIPLTNEFREIVRDAINNTSAQVHEHQSIKMLFTSTNIVFSGWHFQKSYPFLFPDLEHNTIEINISPCELTQLMNKEYIKIIYHSMNNKYTVLNTRTPVLIQHSAKNC